MKILKLISFLYLPFLLSSQTDIQNLGVIYVDESNVGIGLSNPIGSLQIPGSTNKSSIIAGSFEIQSYANNNSWFGENLYYDGGWKYRKNGKGILSYFGDGAFFVSLAPYGLAGADANPVTYFTVANNGNVGIGVHPNPSQKLSVNGGVESEEIQVKQNVADYVFAPEYKLMPLQELEKFILKNQFLPNIQNRFDVENNGGYVELGKLTINLMEKVEELTLHIIELNKRINQLESKND